MPEEIVARSCSHSRWIRGAALGAIGAMAWLVFIGLNLVASVLITALLLELWQIRGAYRDYCANSTDPYRNVFEFLFTQSEPDVSSRKKRAAIVFVLLIGTVWLSRLVYLRYLIHA